MADAPEDAARSQEEILADPRLRALLEPYLGIHHDSVLKSYAYLLAELHRNGAIYESNLEYLLHQHDKPARQYLWLIQRQKLLDLECQWRAGLVEVPQARLTADFDDWQEYIEECTFISPISPAELDLLGEFLGQCTSSQDLDAGSFCELYWLRRRSRRRHPHHYTDDEDGDDDQLTPFTYFWDLRRGTGYLRQLPDLRDEREDYYIDALIADHSRRWEAEPPAEEDNRPAPPLYGPAHDNLMRDWLRRFEPAARLHQFEAKVQLRQFDASDGRGHLALALDRLRTASSGPVPIEAHADWREAVIAAGHRHYLDQVRAALPDAYADYCQRLDLGISPDPATAATYRRSYHHRSYSFDNLAGRIREGRRLLGEPDDINIWE
jgi:hypothetical protein